MIGPPGPSGPGLPLVGGRHGGWLGGRWSDRLGGWRGGQHGGRHGGFAFIELSWGRSQIRYWSAWARWPKLRLTRWLTWWPTWWPTLWPTWWVPMRWTYCINDTYIKDTSARPEQRAWKTMSSRPRSGVGWSGGSRVQLVRGRGVRVQWVWATGLGVGAQRAHRHLVSYIYFMRWNSSFSGTLLGPARPQHTR